MLCSTILRETSSMELCTFCWSDDGIALAYERRFDYFFTIHVYIDSSVLWFLITAPTCVVSVFVFGPSESSPSFACPTSSVLVFVLWFVSFVSVPLCTPPIPLPLLTPYRNNELVYLKPIQ